MNKIAAALLKQNAYTFRWMETDTGLVIVDKNESVIGTIVKNKTGFHAFFFGECVEICRGYRKAILAVEKAMSNAGCLRKFDIVIDTNKTRKYRSEKTK